MPDSWLEATDSALLAVRDHSTGPKRAVCEVSQRHPEPPEDQQVTVPMKLE